MAEKPAVVVDSEKKKKKSESHTKRYGLIVSVPRVDTAIRSEYRKRRTSTNASIAMASILECCIRKFIKAAMEDTTEHKKKRITPECLQRVAWKNKELHQLAGDAIFVRGGVPLDDDMATILQRERKNKKAEAQPRSKRGASPSGESQDSAEPPKKKQKTK